MSLFSHIKVIDPRGALMRRDLADLEDCLAKGWTLLDHHGQIADRALLLTAVVGGWTAGWVKLRQAFPILANDAMVITQACQHLHAGIVQDLFEQGLDPKRRLPDGETPTTCLIEGLGEEVNDPWGENRPGVLPLEERALAMCDLIERFHVDPYAPCPDDQANRARNTAGHSFWTRAVRYRRWAIGQRLLPPDWATLMAQPLAEEALSAVEQAVHPMVDTAVSPGYSPSAIQAELATPLWRALLARWATQWLPRMDWHAANQERDWSLILSLPLAARQAFWQIWNQPRLDGWTTYHTLALESRRTDVQALLRQIVADGVAPESWANQAVIDMTPADLFALEWHLGPDQGRTLADGVDRLPVVATSA